MFMKNGKVVGILLLLALCLGICAEEAKVTLPPKDKFLLVLLAGQSNMAGRGKVEEQDKVPNPRVLMLNKEGEWVPAVDPVHYDKKAAGVGPGRTFGILLAEQNPDATIGLIPTACGGSGIDQWEPGKHWKQTDSYPYDDMLKRARRAMEDGALTVILWHQGEADCGEKRAPNYAAKFNAMIERMRKDLNAPHVPLIIGQLSKFEQKGPWSESKKLVDQAHRDAAAKPNCGFAVSDGLTPNKDIVHFDAPSMREFGKRYFEAYQKIVKADK